MKEIIRDITSANYGDFHKMYKVFEEPPYSEKYTEDELKQEYDFLTKEGRVCGYYKDGICVGMVTFNKRQLYNHPIHYDHPEKVVYLSDLTVLKEFRGHGIGTKLMQYAIEEAKKAGYEIMYMRTLQPGQSMSYGIAVKQGFRLRPETEDIIKERQDANRAELDTRIFLDIQLV